MQRDADLLLERYLAERPELRREWERTQKLKHDPRVTVVGRLLRQTSLDELPQLWNVLKGEMSLVGPRPVVESEMARYGDKGELYRKVRPGITGMWQVSGRNDTTYAERVDLDAYYVRNWSVWLDIHILASTAREVIRRRGAY
jgi:lipopolysaccharide/colanic/teichoic acid biosynthesis glycosyltransferase